MIDQPDSAAKITSKRELAAELGFRLIVVGPTDLHRLEAIFDGRRTYERSSGETGAWRLRGWERQGSLCGSVDGQGPRGPDNSKLFVGRSTGSVFTFGLHPGRTRPS